MAKAFHCSLVTPERSVLEAEATYADVPAHDGQLGVAPGRAAMLVQLGVGKLRLDLAGGGSKAFVLDGGYAQMHGERLTLLCEKAWAEDEISAEAAAAMLSEAEELPMSNTEEVEKRTHDLAVANQLAAVANR